MYMLIKSCVLLGYLSVLLTILGKLYVHDTINCTCLLMSSLICTQYTFSHY